MSAVRIREAKSDDLEQASDLVLRLKRFNSEFDPLFNVIPQAEKKAVQYLRESLKQNRTMVLVAHKGKKITALLRAEIRERHFYDPNLEGCITDFYILPEERHRSLGKELLKEAHQRLHKMGAEVITAEFPAQNQIAARFYTKNGFRPIFNTYAKERTSVIPEGT
jgi:ribosomal protein S18 acetylase RimI-like enzyme